MARGQTIGVDFVLKVRGGKNFAKIQPQDAAFLLWMMPQIAQWIHRRVTVEGRQSDGRATPPYTRTWERRRRKQGKETGSARFDWTGELWRSLTVKPSASGMLKLYFAGEHSTRSKKKTIRNQRLADLLGGRVNPGQYTEAPNAPYEFMNLSIAEQSRVAAEYERHIVRPRIMNLPPVFTQADIPPGLSKFIRIESTKS